MNERIDSRLARAKVARAIFGDDWIEDLSPVEQRIIQAHMRPQLNARADGSFDVIEAPLDKKTARRLDVALGRRHRMVAQLHHAMNWMERHGIRWHRDVEARDLARALAAVKPSMPAETARTGPRDEKFKQA